MQIHDSLLLPDDVLLIPVLELPEETRRSIDCADDDIAVSKLHSRVPSTVVDPGAARLLERFREPRTVVEAVILFSREHSLDAETVLEGAYPLVRKLMDSRFLVSATDAPGPDDGAEPGLAPGRRVGGFRVVRPMYAMEDTEIYLVRDGDDRYGALKIVRSAEGPAVHMLRRELEVLERLEGRIGPAVLAAGDVEGRRFAVLEWCAGVDALSAAWDARQRGERGRDELLALVSAVAGAYADLHEAGVLHGDVHPRNVLVDAGGMVRLIDFGLSPTRGRGEAGVAMAGGIPFYMAPELATAQLDDAMPEVTSHSEQFSLAAMLYELVTGSHYADFGLERGVMLAQIADPAMTSFAARQLPSWPALETVLARALQCEPGDRFPTTRAFAEAVAAAHPEGLQVAPRVGISTGLAAAAEGVLADLAVGGPVWTAGVSPAPTASVNFGAGGLAYLLYRVALVRGDGALLAEAEAWLARAEKEVDRDDGFLNPKNQITADSVGRASPYHSPSGLSVVRALLARTGGNPMLQAVANRRFLEASAEGEVGHDLTLGLSSVLLGTTMLLEAARDVPDVDPEPLRQRGRALRAGLWEHLDGLPAIEDAGIPYLGVAHGWAGFLYATLRWCAAAGEPLPPTLEGRLDELARLAEPLGRGCIWPWTLPRPGEPAAFMPGWCNGSAGFVFLWTAAHAALGDDRWMELAVRSAWHVSDAPERIGSLCCGLLGRAWALLNLHRHTGDSAWLGRARRLAEASPDAQYEDEYPLGLYKGRVALAAVVTDLESPAEAALPFFESEGW